MTKQKPRINQYFNKLLLNGNDRKHYLNKLWKFVFPAVNKCMRYEKVVRI